MQPMPVGLMIHSAALNNVVVDDYQQESDVLAANLSRIRIVPSTEVIVDANGSDVQCSATMYVDMVVSYPRNVDVQVGQSVVWRGIRYRVAVVQQRYDESKLHHLEVKLIDA